MLGVLPAGQMQRPHRHRRPGIDAAAPTAASTDALGVQKLPDPDLPSCRVLLSVHHSGGVDCMPSQLVLWLRLRL